MELALVFFLFIGGTLTFGFGLAWVIPLAAAGIEERKAQSDTGPLALLDLILVLCDLLPIFLIFDFIKQAPEDYSAAKKQWKRESSIRIAFYSSLIAATITLLSWHFLFGL